jgi:hypothetical protein
MFSYSALKYKVFVFVFLIPLVLTLYLQVFYKTSLLEQELDCLSVSLKHPPLAPSSQVEISTEALSGSQWVGERGRRALQP